jgi:arylsulfatase A-like enzyme
VPFYIRYPGVTKPGLSSDVLFASIDIYPTICGLAGVPVPKACSGRDLSSVMRGQKLADPPKAAFLINQFADVNGGGQLLGRKLNKRITQRFGAAAVTEMHGAPNYRSIRTDTHTYAVAENGRWCLFDNIADPYQLKNLIADPRQSALIKSLDAQIAACLKSADDPFPFAWAITLTSPLPVSLA